MLDRLLLGGTPAASDIEFVASTSGYDLATSTGVNISLPSGLQQGDVIIVAGYRDAGPSGHVTPSGWTNVNMDVPILWADYLVCGSTPPTTYVLQEQGFSYNTAWVACVYRRGQWAELANVLDVSSFSSTTGSSGSPDPYGVTTVTDGALILAFGGSNANQTSMAPPAGFTARGQATGAAASIQVAEAKQSTAGFQSVDPFTFSASGSWNACALAIRTKPRATPTSFSIPFATDYFAPGTLVTSTAGIVGADAALALPAVSNVEYSLNGGSTWISSGTLPAGQFSFLVRQPAPASWGGSVNTYITIGGIQSVFAVQSKRTFTSYANGSFTLPAGIPSTVNLVAVGGGGGGGGRTTGATGGSGGGAGGMMCTTTLTNAVAGDVLAFTIGAGGTAGSSTGTAGGTGGDTTMTRNGTTVLLAKGGGGGGPAVAAGGGNAGPAASTTLGTGSTKNAGGNGSNGAGSGGGGYGGGGGGAGGYTGAGGAGAIYSASGAAGVGGGGGGGSSNNISKQYVGGGGGTGVLGAGTSGAGGGTATSSVNGKGGSGGGSGSTLRTGGSPGGGGGGNGAAGAGGAGGGGAIGIYW